MQLNCPKCGNNAFKILTDEEGKPVAECAKCGTVTPFDKSAMTDASKPKIPQSAQSAATKLESQT